MPAPARRRPVLVVSLTLLILIGVPELVLRLVGFENRPAEAPILVWNPTEDALMEESAYLYRFDEDALWSPRPGATIQFGEQERIGGPPELVNADGFRGPRLPRSRTPGKLRIAALGDSSTFGVAVRAEETWSARLGEELERAGTPCEILNAGVEGYTIAQGLQRYRTLVRAWKPDVVIAGFGAVNEHFPADESDLEKIVHRRERARPLAGLRRAAQEKSRLVQWLAWVVDPDASRRALRERDQRLALAQYLGRFSGDPDWPLPRRVGVEEFRASIGELAREVQSDGARLILIVMPRREQAEVDFPVLRAYTRAAYQAAQDLDLQVVGMHARFRLAHREGEPDPPWFIHDYWHPTVHGHAQIALALAPLVLDARRNRGRDADMDRSR